MLNSFRLIFIIMLALLLPIFCFSQVKVGDNPALIDSNSILELESNSKVLVITRLSNLEMNAVTPLQGALVYNTEENCIFYYNGTSWANLCTNTTPQNQTLSFDNTTNILSLENGGQVDLSGLINDADNDTTNEIQTLTLNANILTLTNGTAPPTILDLGSLVGINGADGLSAYQIWLNNGNTGTEAQFLESLVGADGTDGVDGIDGVGGVAQAGTNISITGTGTPADPYIINATDDQIASEISYNNTTSGLLATDVQSAIDEINTATGNVSLLDNGDGTYTFTDSNNNTVTISDTSISTLVDNNNGTYTYINENGTTTTITTQVNNGLSQIPDGTIQLGGTLISPTTITTDNTNTLALQGLENTAILDANSSVVIANNSTGVLSQTTLSSLVQQQQVIRIATDGQRQFAPPAPITDINKIDVYRNGVRIAFSIIDPNILEIEIDATCFAGDEIRIVQLN